MPPSPSHTSWPARLVVDTRRINRQKLDNITFYAADYLHECLAAVLTPLQRALIGSYDGDHKNASCAVVDSIAEVIDTMM